MIPENHEKKLKFRTIRRLTHPSCDLGLPCQRSPPRGSELYGPQPVSLIWRSTPPSPLVMRRTEPVTIVRLAVLREGPRHASLTSLRRREGSVPFGSDLIVEVSIRGFALRSVSPAGRGSDPQRAVAGVAVRQRRTGRYDSHANDSPGCRHFLRERGHTP